MKKPIVIGTFQTGTLHELYQIVKAGVESNFMSFDTAPSYHTEKNLGDAIANLSVTYHLQREQFEIIDKIDAWQMQKTNGNIAPYVYSSIEQMDINYIDLLLIHWPIPEYMDATWKTFEQLFEEGVVKSIGVCNVRKRHLKRFTNYNIKPQYIQIERHPLNTCEDTIRYCREHGINILAYSPLCRMDERLKKDEYLRIIANNHHKNIGQVILRWHIDTGVTPVFMSKKPERIKENLNIFDFKLSDEEISYINSMNQNYKLFLESWGCPGF